MVADGVVDRGVPSGQHQPIRPLEGGDLVLEREAPSEEGGDHPEAASQAVPQLGPGAGGEPDDRGLALETGNPNHDYRFRTPSLRNVTLTAPFFHDGAFNDLGAVLRHYRNPGNSLLNYDPSAHLPTFFQSMVDTDITRNQARIAAVSPIVGGGIPMNNGQIADLIAFMEALEDPAAATPVAVPASVPSGLSVD